MKSTYESFFNTESVSEIKISPELETVQKLMPISQEDYNRLKQSIERDGKIREPLKGYQDKVGNFFLLSGWTRLKIASELGFKTVPVDFIEGLDTKEKRESFAISENLDRRHLTTEQKRELVKYFLKLNPEKSDREISKQTGVDHKTVSTNREILESTGEIPQFNETVGKDGKSRPRKTKKSPSKTSQNQSSKVSKGKVSIDPKIRIKELKSEIKTLETELKEKKKELQKLETKTK